MSDACGGAPDRGRLRRGRPPAVRGSGRPRMARHGLGGGRLPGPVAPRQRQCLASRDRALHSDVRRQRRARGDLVPRPDALGSCCTATTRFVNDWLNAPVGRQPDGQHDHAAPRGAGVPDHLSVRPHRDVQRPDRPRDLRLGTELLRHGPSLRHLVAGRVRRWAGRTGSRPSRRPRGTTTCSCCSRPCRRSSSCSCDRFLRSPGDLSAVGRRRGRSLLRGGVLRLDRGLRVAGPS